MSQQTLDACVVMLADLSVARSHQIALLTAMKRMARTPLYTPQSAAAYAKICELRPKCAAACEEAERTVRELAVLVAPLRCERETYSFWREVAEDAKARAER